MSIRPAAPHDIDVITAMRVELWPDGTAEEHRSELQEFFDANGQGTFVAELEDGTVAGFIEAGLRSHADGCETHPVGYIEGWFVAESVRRRNIGAALVRAAEEWARAQGCTEMASDTWITNEVSQRAHERLGYEEVDRVVVYRKSLT